MKRTTKLLGTALATSTLLLAGCASIVSTHNRPVVITSTPSGIPFSLKDSLGREVHTGVTPATVSLETGAGFFSKAHYSVTFHGSNQQDQVRPLDAKLNGWYFGNIIFGGLIGLLIVDPATGAMWTLPQNVAADGFAAPLAAPAPTSLATPAAATTAAK